jgi:SAM-dependent methyltransferase
MNIGRLLVIELRETLRRPARMLNALRLDRLGRYLRFQRVRLMSADAWKEGDGGVAARKLDSYERYVELQRSKLGYLDLSGHEKRFREVLRERLRARSDIPYGSRVLCLGARLGAEVAAFRDLGCFALGIDVNPGQDNPWVVYGDFHRLEFADHSVDIVYSNSLDHCLSPDKVLAEVRRVLVPEGRLIVEADPGVDDPDGVVPDLWATFQWKTLDAFADLVSGNGFELRDKSKFDYPRNGTTLLFVPVAAART